MAADALGLFFLFFLVAGPNYVLGTYLQSIGRAKVAIALYLLKGLVLVTLVLMLAANVAHDSANWIWLSRTVAEVGAFTIIGIYTLSQKGLFYSDQAILN